MKPDVRISIKDFRRGKSLRVELRRPLHTARQFWVRMNGARWPGSGWAVSLSRLMAGLRKALVRACAAAEGCRPGAKSYELQSSVDPATGTSWVFKMTAGKSSGTLYWLASGTRIWVLMRAVGADNAVGPWSDPAVKTVL
jgi:hypothetical protein